MTVAVLDDWRSLVLQSLPRGRKAARSTFPRPGPLFLTAIPSSLSLPRARPAPASLPHFPRLRSIIKQGKVVVVLSGRFAGRKAVVLRT
jgi:hypothetical protein